MAKNPFRQAGEALNPPKPKPKPTKTTKLPSLSAPKATVREASMAAAQRRQAAKSKYSKSSTNKGKS